MQCQLRCRHQHAASHYDSRAYRWCVGQNLSNCQNVYCHSTWMAGFVGQTLHLPSWARLNSWPTLLVYRLSVPQPTYQARSASMFASFAFVVAVVNRKEPSSSIWRSILPRRSNSQLHGFTRRASLACRKSQHYAINIKTIFADKCPDSDGPYAVIMRWCDTCGP